MTNIQAINLLKGLEQSLDDYCELNDEGKTAFRMAIAALELFGNAEQLPSAQPEKRTEKRAETHACDLISRQDAIDALWKALYEYEDRTEKQFQDSDELDVGEWIVHRIFVQNMSDIDRQTIMDLPSAQTEPCGDVPDNNVGECEDAVSRADVEHEIANILRGIFVEYQDIAKKTASKLPSVTSKRKTGKWEEKAVSDEKVIDEWQSARCSACGKYHTAPYMYYFNNYNYCPNCGARMTEEDV